MCVLFFDHAFIGLYVQRKAIVVIFCNVDDAVPCAIVSLCGRQTSSRRLGFVLCLVNFVNFAKRISAHVAHEMTAVFGESDNDNRK